ncbi:MAG: molybdate ABC transporter substrate-binding protein [Candidatus Sedimenticola sp. (ex Thyasira tokunagai)]
MFRFSRQLIFSLLLVSGNACSDEIRVAVASNFFAAIEALARQFEGETGHKVTLVIGSSGKHYAQIHHGAPYDLFFSADERRPRLLEEAGDTVSGSRFTYAVGKLMLWSPSDNLVNEGGKVLEQGKFRYLAIANPKLAPYGKAAQEVLQSRRLWKPLRSRMVRGENIGQTFQFVRSGNAELGFVAYSQIKRPGETISGSYWKVPQGLYTPITQQAVLLRESAVARNFLEYVKSDTAQKTIRAHGYATH